MRALILASLLLAAGCSEGGGESAAKQAEAPADTTLEAGQWEVTTEVTRLTKLDDGTPVINTPAGTKASFASCIAEADRKKPSPALFAGDKADCEYKDFYMARGRMNASLSCNVPGINGDVVTSVEGKNDATSFEGTLSTSTRLASSGDVRIAARINGRKVGACTAAG